MSKITYNCAGCIYSHKIQFFDFKEKELKINEEAITCHSAEKAIELIEKSGVPQILFPMIIDVGNNHCNCKVIKESEK